MFCPFLTDKLLSLASCSVCDSNLLSHSPLGVEHSRIVTIFLGVLSTCLPIDTCSYEHAPYAHIYLAYIHAFTNVPIEAPKHIYFFRGRRTEYGLSPLKNFQQLKNVCLCIWSQKSPEQFQRS